VSEANVELVRALVAAAPDDMSALVDDDQATHALEAVLDPEFEFVFAGRGEGSDAAVDLGGVYKGVDGFRAAMRDWLSAWESYRNLPEEFIDAGEQVVVLTREQGRTRTHNVETTVETASVWTIRQDKVLRLEAYLDRASALEAAGLRP
jgi:ketosteroid isomerase-like protein